MIAYLFYSEVESLTEGKNTEIAKIIGGSLFIIYGVIIFFKKLKPQPVDEDGKIIITNENDNWKSFIKGFILNFANPMVIFYWFSVMTLASKSTDLPNGNSMPVLAFIGIILVTFFTFDVLKILGAKQLRPLMTENILKAFNQLIGIVFLGFGFYLLITAYVNFK